MEKEKFKLLYGDWKPQCSTIDVEGNHCPEPVNKYIEFDEHRAIPICAKCLEALNHRNNSKRAQIPSDEDIKHWESIHKKWEPRV